MKTIKAIIFYVPVPITGVALGLTALGNLLQSYSEAARCICCTLGLFLLLLLAAKFLLFPGAAAQDFENPVIASVSATIFMSLMQLCAYAYPFVGTPAKLLWLAAICCHFALMLWYGIRFLSRRRLDEIYPTCFITYVGIVAASVTSSVFQHERLGLAIFFFGFSAYMVMLILITLRYTRHAVPEQFRPLFCIYAAPMSLSLAGYLTAAETPSLLFAVMLEAAAQLLYLIVLVQLPGLLKLPFYPSYAAFTFPFVITAFALKKLLLLAAQTGTDVPPMLFGLLNAETAVAFAMVTYTLIRYLLYLIFCAKSAVSKPAAKKSAA